MDELLVAGRGCSLVPAVRRGMDVEPHRDISFSCQHSEPGSREERKAGLLTLLRCIATGGRRTEGRGRTQELPAQTPQSADLRGREREDRERRRSFSEASTDSVSCQGGRARAGHTKQFGRNKSQKDGNDRSTSTATGRSIEKSEKANEEILGGKQRERGGDDVSQPPVGPLLSRLSNIDGHILPPSPRRRLRPFLCKSLCYATINKEGGRQAGRLARPSQRRSCRSWDG